MKKVLWETLRRSEFERAVKEDAIVIIPSRLHRAAWESPAC